jgi:hypothetical protein
MALKFFTHIFIWIVCWVFLIERILIGYVLKCKDQNIFYKNFQASMLGAYMLLIYFTDEEACQWVPDIFLYIYHFTFYTTMEAFKWVLDNYCRHVLESQLSYDLIPEARIKIKKMGVYYRILKYIQIAFLVISFYLFIEVDKMRLLCLYTPGIKVLIDWFLSYENIYYKYKTTMSINEHVITWTLNYWFFLNTISMVIQLSNYFLIFSKTGISITFSFIHIYYMMKNFKFLFKWTKEWEKFWVFD